MGWLKNRYLVWVLGGVAAIVLSLGYAGLGRGEILNLNGWPQLWRFLVASGHPDLSAELLGITLEATVKTLAYAVCGTCLTVAIGSIGGIFCSEVWWESLLRSQGKPARASWLLLVRSLLVIPRAIHEVIWGLLFINLWGLDPLTAVLAIAVPFGAITAKVFSELLDETPRQPLKALLNSGVAPLPALVYTIVPQAFLDLLSYSFYRFECALRSAAVLGLIGAGGLGYEILLSLQSLKYEQLWTFFYALIILNGCVDYSSAWFRDRLGCSTRLDLNLGRKRRPALARRSMPDKLPVILFGMYGLLSIGSFLYIQPDFSKLWQGITWQRLGQIIQSCFPPDWPLVPQLGNLCLQTGMMSVLAIMIAAIGGMVLAFPAAHNLFLPGGLFDRTHRSLGTGWLSLGLSRLSLLMCRAIPAPIWALVLLFVLFPGVLPGAIALGLHNLGILGRLKAEVIENLDFRPLNALKAQGTPSLLVFLYGVLPMTVSRFLAYDLYRWEVCMRETVIVGLVGAGGLGRVMTEQLSSFDYRGLIVSLSGFLILTFGIDGLSSLMRRSLR